MGTCLGCNWNLFPFRENLSNYLLKLFKFQKGYKFIAVQT